MRYDLLVIGGGSGGLAAAKAAAAKSVKTCVIEGSKLGGTCVNLGCVPKKIMFNAASIVEGARYGELFGFAGMGEFNVHWKMFKEKRDATIKRLNGIYENSLTQAGCDFKRGWAQFSAEQPGKNGKGNDLYYCIDVTLDGHTEQIEANRVIIAVGGYPKIPNIPGKELGISSDGVFALEERPKRVAVIGSGYIAIEMAGIFNAFGADTHMFIRTDRLLRSFDKFCTEKLIIESRRTGLKMHFQIPISALEKADDGTITVVPRVQGLDPFTGFDVVLFAIGRTNRIASLALDRVGVTLTSKRSGEIIAVDEKQETSAAHIYSLGDVTGPLELTPVAIKAGRLLIKRLYEGDESAIMDYTNVPSVVFSHPPFASCGLTYEAAVTIHGKENVTVYSSTFINLYFAMYDDRDQKERSYFRIICVGEEERLVGAHGIGHGVDESMQFFPALLKNGCTKVLLDTCVAIHPTASEEWVLMAQPENLDN